MPKGKFFARLFLKKKFTAKTVWEACDRGVELIEDII